MENNAIMNNEVIETTEEVIENTGMRVSRLQQALV